MRAKSVHWEGVGFISIRIKEWKLKYTYKKIILMIMQKSGQDKFNTIR